MVARQNCSTLRWLRERCLRCEVDLDGRYCIDGKKLDVAPVVDFDSIGAKAKQLTMLRGKHDLPRSSLADGLDGDDVKQLAKLWVTGCDGGMSSDGELVR